MVLAAGLEPARAYAHYPLKIACLPIPPRQQTHPLYDLILWLSSIILR